MSSPAAYRSPRSLATAATVLLVVCGALTVFRLVADSLLYRAAGDLPSGVEFGDGSAFGPSYGLQMLAYLLYSPALMGSTVAFLGWFHRVRVNAEWLSPHGHRHSRGWAVGGWFTPVVFLWFPWRIACDIWQAGVRPDASGVRTPLPTTVVNAWWVSFCLFNVMDAVGSQVTDGARHPDQYQQGVAWLIASDALQLVAAVLAVLVVRTVTAMQEERFAEHSAATSYGVYVSAVEG
ncbi:DUF4328 domain-containing protein [Kitasatospora sp. NPDC059827]|uniref:DUF4328 domain-containing protein n=1 Tax=Kitasatospora sp. NPDC059827 TaxID=3346964 RepID=UPI00365D3129